MAEEERKDENVLNLLANNMGLLGLCSPDEAQAVTSDKNGENKVKDAVAKKDPSPSFSEDWQPPELVVRDFPTIPKYVDDSGVIYLYDIELTHARELIRKDLYKKYCLNFKDPDPEATSTKWSVGEPCVAIHSIHQAFRGRVLEVNQEDATCAVYFIDHAVVHTCPFTRLRKDVPLREIPPHSLTCALSRIRPMGKTWDQETINFIRNAVIEQKCYVKVLGEEKVGILPIELMCDSLWLNDYLVNTQRAKYQDSWIIKENKDTSSNKDEDSAAEFLTFPRYTRNEFVGNITQITDVYTLPVQILYLEEEGYTGYEQMFQDLQYRYVVRVPLDGIFENKACMVLKAYDNQWYRASIQQFNKALGCVQILYVDHGDTDVIPLDNVREIYPALVQHPPVSLRVKLFGMELNREKDIRVVAQSFAEVFLETMFERGLFIVNIVGYEGTVPLVQMRYSSRNWVHSKLIEHEILISSAVSVVRHSSLDKNNFMLACVNTRKIKGKNSRDCITDE